jgi:hypothetical protein
VALDRFIIDETYMQKISGRKDQAQISKMAAKFSWQKFVSVPVSDVGDGRFKLLDGQHRIAAARLVNIIKKREAISLVPVTIFQEMTVEEEADVFVAINEDRHSKDPFVIHRAKLAAGPEAHPEAYALERLVAGAHLRITPGKPNRLTQKPGDVVCLGALTKMQRRYEPQVMTDALGAVSDAYRYDRFGIRRGFIDAAIQLIIKGATREELRAAFRKSTPDELQAEADATAVAGTRKRQADQIERVLLTRIESLRATTPMTIEQKAKIVDLIERRA